MKYGLQLVQAWSPRNKVQNVSKFLLDAAITAEDAGWDGFYLWDHLYFTWAPVPVPDSWSVVAAAATHTKHIRLGTNVTAIPRRRPQVLAKQLATIDQLSDGRVILGAGLGGSGHEKGPGVEFSSFGEPENYRVLAKMTDEALDVITGLWKGEPLHHQGTYYKVDNVAFHPTPIQKPRIPIWIGAIKNPALKRAAKYDGWITGGPCPSVGEQGLTYRQVEGKMNIIQKHRASTEPIEIVYGFEFPDAGVSDQISSAEESGVTWMLDIVSAMRFNGPEALEYIKQGPKE